MNGSSRIAGFYTRAVPERRREVLERIDGDAAELSRALDAGGLDLTTADKTVENVIGTYALPFSIALNTRINGRDYLVPMVVEEPSVVAAASNAARMVREGGGFDAEADASIIAAQIQLWNVVDSDTASAAVLTARDELLARANSAVPGLVERGGGAREIEVRALGDGLMVVHVLLDVCDAMGANLANTVAEALGARVAELTRGEPGLRILSNLSDRRCVRVRASIPCRVLATATMTGESVRDGIVRASRFAARDPYRAATHNKGVMNGVDAVVMATGNDWRAVEAGAHAFAARTGTYAPLATWRAGDDGSLVGEIELPLALGTVGGTLRVHPAARMALRILGVSSSRELAMVAASMGLASNLAALRALATEGIQKGHMALHARSVAQAAGARGDEVDVIAARITAMGEITVIAAQREIASLYASATEPGTTAQR